MLINKFINAIHAIQPNWLLTNRLNEEIYSFKPYPKNNDFQENMLYIGYLSNLPTVPDELRYNFLCIEDHKTNLTIPQLQEKFSNCNLIVTPMPISFRSLCDLASEIFLAETKYTSYVNHMVTASNADKGLEYLVDEVYSILKCPLIVVDTSYKILAMYKDITIESRPDLETQRELGYLTTRNIQRMKQDKIYEKARNAKYPYYLKAVDEEYGWMNSIVYIHGIEVAQIGMLELNHKFTTYDFEFLNFFSQLVSWEMQKNDFYKNNRGIMHSVFLSDLLDFKIPNQRIATLRKEQLNWIDAPFLYVFTIFDNEIHAFNQRAQIVAYQIQHLLPAARYVIYDSRLVFLVQQTEQDTSIFQEDSLIAEFLSSNHLTGIISNCFSDLLQTKKYYNQTLKIHELRQLIPDQKIIYFYSDYMFYHIGQILSEKYNLTDFYHPAVLKMMEYDKENQSNFIDTLYEYLIHVDNPTLSARHLFIHKNTFFYRMNKIRELFNLDLNNGEERLKLHLTLEFLKLEELTTEKSNTEKHT